MWAFYMIFHATTALRRWWNPPFDRWKKLRLRSRIFHGHTNSKQRICTFLEEPRLWQAEQWQQWPTGQIQQISTLVLTFVLTSYLAMVSEPLWLSQLTSLDLSFLICHMRTLLPDISVALYTCTVLAHNDAPASPSTFRFAESAFLN